MPGCGGIITVTCDEKDAVCSLERAYQAAAVENSDDEGAILGYPALAKFTAVTHHGYNVLKMPGSDGIITVPCEEKDAVCSLERAFQAASVEDVALSLASPNVAPTPIA